MRQMYRKKDGHLIPVKNVHLPQTRYLKSVKPPSTNMLKRGKLNKKLGDKVAVRMWKGMTMYSLTLEERATCPEYCEQWQNCYGNNMPFGHRFDHTDPAFKPMLELQLEELNRQHPEGFVVRLHVLGDFYDALYITSWQIWLHKFPNLHVFGYTHHESESTLGDMINNVNRIYPDRFRFRFSDDRKVDFSARVISEPPTRTHSMQYTRESGMDWRVVCPEQLNRTESCTTCGYCWSSDKPIIFIEH